MPYSPKERAARGRKAPQPKGKLTPAIDVNAHEHLHGPARTGGDLGATAWTPYAVGAVEAHTPTPIDWPKDCTFVEAYASDTGNATFSVAVGGVTLTSAVVMGGPASAVSLNNTPVSRGDEVVVDVSGLGSVTGTVEVVIGYR